MIVSQAQERRRDWKERETARRSSERARLTMSAFEAYRVSGLVQLVAQPLLHGPDVVAVLGQMGGERMTKRVARRGCGDPSPAQGVLDGALEHGLVPVRPAPLARHAIHVGPGGMRHPLPGPLAPRVRVRARERPGQIHPARAALEVYAFSVRRLPWRA